MEGRYEELWPFFGLHQYEEFCSRDVNLIDRRKVGSTSGEICVLLFRSVIDELGTPLRPEPPDCAVQQSTDSRSAASVCAEAHRSSAEIVKPWTPRVVSQSERVDHFALAAQTTYSMFFEGAMTAEPAVSAPGCDSVCDSSLPKSVMSKIKSVKRSRGECWILDCLSHALNVVAILCRVLRNKLRKRRSGA